nr:MAG TPA: Transcription-repair coupling factor [Caudoviricetes sp.]
MTREEVKAQLAKCPLEWEREARPFFGYDYLKAEIKRGDLRVEYRIRYDYENYVPKRVELYLTAMDCVEETNECIEMHISGNFRTPDEMKALAEAHRLDFICRLLGIND